MGKLSNIGLNYTVLSQYAPIVAGKALKMLDRGKSGKRIRRYVLNAVDAALVKKVDKKKVPIKVGPQKVFRLPEDTTIGDKYKALAGSHASIYSPLLYGYSWLGHVLVGSEQYERQIANQGPTIPLMFKASRGYEQLRDVKSKIQPKLVVEAEQITSSLTLPVFSLAMSVGGDDAAEEYTNDYVKLVKKFFPDFKLPKKFARAASLNISEEEAKQIGVSADSDYVLFEGLGSLTKTFTIGELQAMNLDYEHSSSHWNTGENLIIPQDMVKSKSVRQLVRQHVKYTVTLLPDIATTTRNMHYAYRNMQKGEIGKDAVKLYFKVYVEAKIEWPLEYAYYSTCVRIKDDFVPALFYRFLQWNAFSYSLGGVKRGRSVSGVKVPARISNFTTIKKDIAREAATRGVIKPRVNEDGFAILSTAAQSTGNVGSVVWLPTNADATDDYLDYYRSAYDPVTGLIQHDKEKQKALMNRPIFVDWYNEKFVFGQNESSDHRGFTQTLDLLGCKPLNNITIYDHLTKTLAKDRFGEAFIGTFGRAASAYLAHATLGMEFNAAHLLKRSILYKNMSEEEISSLMMNRLTDVDTALAHLVKNFPEEITYGILGGMPFSPQIEKSPRAKAAIKLVRNAATELYAKFDEFPFTYSQKIVYFRFRVWLIAKYALNYNKLQTEYADRIEQNTFVEKDPDAFNFKMANMGGVPTVLPHQSKTLSTWSPEPVDTILFVQAGGGKTPISMAKALQLIAEGKVKRPLVIAPGQLVRQWAAEIQEFSKGQVNAFPMTLETVRTMQQLYQDPADKSINYKKLADIISSYPPNTIFLASSTFTTNNRRSLVYGNDTTDRYMTAEFLRDLGFDLVIIDESQYVKNTDSSRTTAAAVIATSAKYLVRMSGTVIHNTLVDLVGQMAIGNAAALGSKTHFENTYYKNKVPLPGAAEEVREIIKPYTQFIYVPRREWAFALPRIEETFHPVDFTAKQRKFYDSLMKNAIDEIMADEKFKKKMLVATEEDAASIEAKLGAYFANVEEFVYAPDANPAYVTQSNLAASDLVSPKVKVMDDLISAHLRVSKDKIIVFSYRRATSQHIMRHTKHKDICSHYTAGDLGAIQRFLDDDRIKVLVADEASISMGQNYQIASRLIRFETRWTSGDMDQAIARIWRLAFKKGKGRKTINLDHIFTENSLEVAKIARLVSKTIVARQFQEAENEHFTKIPLHLSDEALSVFSKINVRNNLPIVDSLPSLAPIVMNLETLLELNNSEQLGNYFETYTLLNFWEDKQFEIYANDPKMRLYDVPDKIKTEIKGSKVIPYTPRAPGQEPYDPGGKLGLVAISVKQLRAETDAAMTESDDDGDDQEVVVVRPGDLVDTEFGYGVITRVKADTIDVRIKGMREEVTVPKSTSYIVTNDDARRAIIKTLKMSAAGDPKVPPTIEVKKGNVANPKYNDDEGRATKTFISAPKPVPKVVQKAIEEDDESEEGDTTRFIDGKEVDITDDDGTFEAEAILMDRRVAIVCFEADNDTAYLKSKLDFRLFPAFYAIHIRNTKALNAVMDKLTNRFSIDQSYLNSILAYGKQLQAKTLFTFDPSSVQAERQLLKVTSFKKVKEGVLRPYPLVWNGDLFLVVTKATHPSARKMKTVLASVPGVAIRESDDILMKLYPNAAEASAFLTEMKDKIHKKSFTAAMGAIDAMKPYLKRTAIASRGTGVIKQAKETETMKEKMARLKKKIKR